MKRAQPSIRYWVFLNLDKGDVQSPYAGKAW